MASPDEKDQLNRLATLVRERRVERGLPKAAVARDAAISINTYQRIEDGERVRDVVYPKVEYALGWVIGSCRAILKGASAPLGTREDASSGVKITEVSAEDLQQSVTSAIVATVDTMTAAEIRELSGRLIDELKKRGLVP